MHRTQFLVDTDVIINYLKGKENARDFLIDIIDERAVGFFSVITGAELVLATANEKHFKIFQEIKTEFIKEI
jgi:predicted nucleic acid-binding protein